MPQIMPGPVSVVILPDDPFSPSLQKTPEENRNLTRRLTAFELPVVACAALPPVDADARPPANNTETNIDYRISRKFGKN